MKQCYRCREWKPLSLFTKNKRLKDGIHHECSPCYSERQARNRRLRNPLLSAKEEFWRKHPNEKRCSVCHEIKPKTEFYSKGKTMSAVKSCCKKCQAEKHKTRYSLDKIYRSDRNLHGQKNHRDSPRQTLRHAVKGALKRRPCDNPITTDYVMDLWRTQEGRCALSGIKMTWASGHGMPIATSVAIDRIDQHGDYTHGNVRLLANCINNFRGVMNDEQMRERLAQFHAYQFDAFDERKHVGISEGFLF